MEENGWKEFDRGEWMTSNVMEENQRKKIKERPGIHMEVNDWKKGN